MEDLQFVVFDNQTKLVKKERNDVVTTKEECIRFLVTLLLITTSLSSTNKRIDTGI